MDFRQTPSTRRQPRKRIPRAVAAVLLALQALLWGGGSIAEARTAAESLYRYSHVEDQVNVCPPLHRHFDCLICRTFSGGATSGSAPGVARIESGSDECPSLADMAPVRRTSSGPLGSRAPPNA